MRFQRGAVLVVSLIFLLIITAIAVVSLSSSKLQTIMVSNAQQRETIFRDAESAIEQALSTANGFMQARSAPNGYTVPNVTATGTDGVAQARIVCIRTRLLEGSQFGDSGGAAASFRVFVYEVTGTANTNDDRIASRVVQGVAVGSQTFGAGTCQD